MSQQPFSRPGAVDLSSLKRPPAAGGPAGQGAGGAGTGAGSGAYSVYLDEQNVQTHLQSSITAPVVLVVFSPSQSPESARMAEDLDLLADEFEGRILVGKVDVDTTPQLAQALQVPSVPLVALVVQGRMMPMLQDVAHIDDIRALLGQVLQQMATQGVTGRHQPVSPGAGAAVPDETVEGEYVDPRYAPALDAMAAGDVDAAVAEYRKLVEASPADAEAAGGLAMATLLQRTQGVEPAAARAAAAERRDDVDAQTLAADLDLLGGHVEDAFTRLVDLVRRTTGAERDRVRTHLIDLFAAVGNDDPRVLKARQGLASALF